MDFLNKLDNQANNVVGSFFGYLHDFLVIWFFLAVVYGNSRVCNHR